MELLSVREGIQGWWHCEDSAALGCYGSLTETERDMRDFITDALLVVGITFMAGAVAFDIFWLYAVGCVAIYTFAYRIRREADNG